MASKLEIMNVKTKLTVVSFLQFFVWGAWLTTIATYCIQAKGWSFPQFGAIFSTLALASIFMPPLVGIIADKYLNAEKLYGILHLAYGAILLYVPQVDNPDTLYYVILAAMAFYMPSISLSNSLSYTILKNNNFDVISVFPGIRTWGTIGFIAAMWVTNLTGSKITSTQFIIGGVAAIALGLYSFTMLPACKPPKNIKENASLTEKLGLQAFSLFKTPKMAMFFVFAMLLGAALQLTNMYADVFLSSFESIEQYKDSVMVKYSTIVVSISQISETVFILAIPFFLKKFGIKKVMLFSMLAWFLRFGLFAYGNPGTGFVLIILSCIVYGLAFDFFNISGSLFIETSTDSSIRGSAQGLFMMMSNGIGAYLGSKISASVIDTYFKDANGATLWQGAWLSFAIYALVVAIIFSVVFKHKHDASQLQDVKH
jgi:MFS transporter, NHS family, xanthosine permease